MPGQPIDTYNAWAILCALCLAVLTPLLFVSFLNSDSSHHEQGTSKTINDALIDELPIDEVRGMLSNRPDEASKRDVNEDLLPLHQALLHYHQTHSRTNAQDKTTLLLELLKAFPDAASAETRQGFLPIHYALTTSADDAVIEELIALHPPSVHVRDEFSRATNTELVERHQLVLGNRHPCTLSAIASLALLYASSASEGRDDSHALRAAAANTAKAISLYRECLAGRREALGAGHPDTLNIAVTLAGLLERTDATGAAAISVYEEYCLSAKTQGDIEATTIKLHAMTSLADLYKRQQQQGGSVKKALVVFAQAVEIAEHELGTSDPFTLTLTNNLAGCYESMDEHSQALPLYFATLELRRELMGEDSIDTLCSMSNLGSCYRDLERLQEGRALLEACVAATIRVLGQDSVYSLRFRDNLCFCVYKQGLAVAEEGSEGDSWQGVVLESVDMYEDLVADMQDRLGHDHGFTERAKARLEMARQSLRKA